MKKAVVSIFLVMVLILSTVTTTTHIGYADTIPGVVAGYSSDILIYTDDNGKLSAFDERHEVKKVVYPTFEDYQNLIKLIGYYNGLYYDEAEFDLIDGRLIEKDSDGNTNESYHYRRTVHVQFVIIHKEAFELLSDVQKLILTERIGPWWPQYLVDQALTFYGDNLVGERMEEYDPDIHVLLAEYQVTVEEGDWFGLYVNKLTREITFCKGGEAPAVTQKPTKKPVSATPAPQVTEPTGDNTPAPPTATPTPVPVATPVVTPDPETPIVTQAPATPVVVPDPEVPIGAQATPVAVPDKEQPIQEAVPAAVPDGEVAIPQSVPDGEEKIG